MGFPFARFSGTFRRYFHRDGVLRNSFSAAAAFFRSSDTERLTLRSRILAAVRKILAGPDGTITPERGELFARMVEEFDGETDIKQQLEELRVAPEISGAELGAELAALPADARQKIIHFLLTLTLAANAGEEQRRFVEEAAETSAFPTAEFVALNDQIMQEIRRRERILRSGTGIAVALIVLLVFVLTATLLRSVIFGFLAAYLLLPVEKYFERKLRNRSGLWYWLSRACGALFFPLARLSRAMTRKDSSATPPTPEDQTRRREKSIISRAVTQTALAFFTVIIALALGLSALTGKYVNRIGDSVREWSQAQEPKLTQTAEPGEKVLSGPRYLLDRLRSQLDRSPLLREWISGLEEMLRDENTRQELLSILVRRSGGIFSFTAGLLGTIGALFFDLLLATFFALLFLLKLAEFCHDDDSSGKRSEYIVRTVFNGNWLPGADEATIGEARRIIGGVFNRLRIWARGYITLMLIDGTVYTILFGLLRIPYFPLLGMLAGCGILLPYIGPITACAVTLLVTFLAGNGSAIQIVGVLVCFLLYSGFIEQFILYPMVIGESLGLTTLETIIVVLLGAVFAGIPGMILALPAASVLKYLVPQLYRYWGPEKHTGLRPS